MQGSVTILSDGSGNVAINSQGAPNLPPEFLQHIFGGLPGLREIFQRQQQAQQERAQAAT